VLLAETDLPVRQAGDIAFVLLGSDPFEDAREVFVLDDRARLDACVRLWVERAASTRSFARIVTAPSSASLTSAVAPRRRRVPTASSST
jgi:hypothetical protein